MKKSSYSDEACAIILMHHTIKNLNKTISSQIARIYGDDADYSWSFRQLSHGFSDSDLYKKYLTQAHNDSISIYKRLQPQTLFEYNLYLNHVALVLQQFYGVSLPEAIADAKTRLNFPSPKFYSDYAPTRTATTEELIRGLKYIKCLIAEAYKINPNEVKVPEAEAVIYDRLHLECEREVSKAGKKKARLSSKTQEKATDTLGGSELISPFSLDNLAVSEDNTPKKKPTQRGEDE